MAQVNSASPKTILSGVGERETLALVIDIRPSTVAQINPPAAKISFLGVGYDGEGLVPRMNFASPKPILPEGE